MCGGFVIAYTAAKIEPATPRGRQFVYHLAYNLGRISSYALIGALFGFLGGILLISPLTQGILYLAVGIFMVLMGFSLLGNLKFLNSIEVSLTRYSFFKRLFSKLIHSKSMPSFFFLGMLNGFLPCGLVYFFAASAAATASPFWGAVVMIIFGLSTVPVMLGLGTVAGFLKSSRFRTVMIKLASVVIVLYGIYIVYKGYWFIFDPAASIHTCH